MRVGTTPRWISMMSISPHPRRGDVVLVDFPFSSGSGGKRRPALIVQNDQDNARLQNTIVATISSNTSRVHEATQFLIDIATPDGQASGLHHDSAVICNNLFTIETRLVIRRIGDLPKSLMSQVEDRLKAVLELP